ncbi:MAG: YicC/YloC family endoribonuclease [Peptostreptococcaceae bacterium]|nr:YicC/YloC family endoribonuclease [Peptostreptococcaceae bacterium]
MAISMTGYGRGEYLDEKYHFVVEVKSVNNRYLDINIKIPRRINYLEEYVRQHLKKFVSRGKLEVYIKLELSSISDTKVGYDGQIAKEYITALRMMATEFEIPNNISVLDVAKFPDVIRLEENQLDENELKEALTKAMDGAFEALRTMRELEGEGLKKDIIQRCDLLGSYLRSIEENAEDIESEYRNKLMVKIQDILDAAGAKVDEQRIVQEAAIMADKSSITEEIVRFQSHIGQLKEVMQTDTIGRKMDFILQEMNREVNTIGSKSSKIEITNYVVELKSELEKIREQVQNIE